MQHALFIVAPENFQDKELFDSLEVVKKSGAECTIASKEAGTCHGKLGASVEAVIGLNQINAADFDAIIFIGGGGSQVFFEDPSAHLLAQKAIENSKVLAAICAAPTILANAGVLENKKATCFPAPEYENILNEQGAQLTRSDLEVDGKIITASGPSIAKEFGEKIAELMD